MPQHPRVFQGRELAVNRSEDKHHVLRRLLRKIELFIQTHEPGVAGGITLRNGARLVVQVVEEGVDLLLSKDVHARAANDLTENRQPGPASIGLNDAVHAPQVLAWPQQATGVVSQESEGLRQ